MKVKEILNLVYEPVKLFCEEEICGKYGKETDYFESEYNTITGIRKHYGDWKIKCIMIHHGDNMYEDAVAIYAYENHEEN